MQSIPGFGLFYCDTCYLSTYALRVHGTAPLLLMSSGGVTARLSLRFFRQSENTLTQVIANEGGIDVVIE